MRPYNMTVSSVGLRPLSDCTADYRPIILAERVPYRKKKERNCQT
jgi:hypothetical protein